MIMNENKIYNVSLFTDDDFRAARRSWVFDLCGDESTNSDSIPGMSDLLSARDGDSEKMRLEMNRASDTPILFGDKAPAESVDLTEQYGKIWRMALPFGTYGCKHYHSEELLCDILYALDWMHDNMYGEKILTDSLFRSWKIFNWWDWYVGAATPLTNILMMIEDFVDDALIRKYVVPVDFLSDKMRTAPTLAEAMSRMVTLTPLALIKRDKEMMEKLYSECVLLLEKHDGGDNMRRDYCCMTHVLPYNVGYGFLNLNRVARVIKILSRSPLAYPLDNLDNLKGMLRYTFAPVMYKGRTLAPMNGRVMQEDNCASLILSDVHYLLGLFGDEFDREIYRLIRQNDSAEIREKLLLSPGTNITAYKHFYAALNDPSYSESPSDSAYFWYSGDICVQHRHASMIGLRMPSCRTIAYESMNGKHGDGWYTGDGALYLYTPTGMDEFSPAWWQGLDKTMIPGTTVEDREREIMFFNCGWRPDRDFVGGVCLSGKYLTASMDYESFHNELDEGRPDTGAGRSLPVYNCTLTANKSYFFFDKAILCLGSDIVANDGYRVRTVVENRVLDVGECLLADGEAIPFTEGEISLSAKRIFIPNAGGFIFPEGGNIKVKFYEKASLRYASVYFDHGVDPKGEKYAYIILPNATAEETAAYSSEDVKILRNDGEIQAARESSSSLCGIAFRKSECLCGISADHGMIAMMKQGENGKIAFLTVCDPTQRRTDISFSVGGEKIRIETDRARGKAYNFEF